MDPIYLIVDQLQAPQWGLHAHHLAGRLRIGHGDRFANLYPVKYIVQGDGDYQSRGDFLAVEQVG